MGIKQAESPFAEDDYLMVQLKIWLRKDLDHLNAKKAGIFINDKLLSNWSKPQLLIYKIFYPVSDSIVTRWLEESGFRYTIHKKCYYVNLHKDNDVVADRNTYLKEFFGNEILEPYWIQLPKRKLNHFKYKTEWPTEDSDISTKMQNYIKKHRVYFLPRTMFKWLSYMLMMIYIYI